MCGQVGLGSRLFDVTLKKWSGRGDLNARPPAPKGARVASKGSIRYGPSSMFTTTWGICFSLRSKPKAVKVMGFGTVLAQSAGVLGSLAAGNTSE